MGDDGLSVTFERYERKTVRTVRNAERIEREYHIMKLTAKSHDFIRLVVEGVNATEAYRRTYDISRMKERTVYANAHRLRHDPDVEAEIARLIKEKADQSVKSAADVTNEFLHVAFADPGDIVQHRRLCCRFCHGVDHKYQWRDADEFEEAIEAFEAVMAKRKRRAPNDEGGYGFAHNKPPHPGCPKCMGEGTPDVFIVDTTKLTPEKRRLIERVRVTKDGIEIRFRNQSDALTKAGQMLGGFKSTVVLQNPDGTAIQNAPTLVALAPEDAAARYKEWMDNGTGNQ